MSSNGIVFGGGGGRYYFSRLGCWWCWIGNCLQFLPQGWLVSFFSWFTFLIFVFVGENLSFGGSYPLNISENVISASSFSVTIGANGTTGVGF